MRILVLNIDSKLPNIALNKVAMWHQAQGDVVIWDMPIMLKSVDRVYASSIFTKNRPKLDNLVGLRPDILAGGTGYDLNVKLPADIEAMKPKINYGFTTRGCIRKCPFCFVWQSEGYIRPTGDIYDLWDGASKEITLLDNNILALPNQFAHICSQAIKEGLTVDFNQGLDIRLITPELGYILSKVKTKDIRFAFDSPKLEKTVRRKIAMLRRIRGFESKAFFFYVLVGFDTTFDEDLHRCQVLKELGCRPYVMRHENTPRDNKYIKLAEWANQMWTLAKYSYEEFCYKRANRYKEVVYEQDSLTSQDEA